MRRWLSGTTGLREFAGFDVGARQSGIRAKRALGKAGVMAAGDIPRFILDNLPADGPSCAADRARFTPASLNTPLDCGRGE